jgi:hypothetical protein
MFLNFSNQTYNAVFAQKECIVIEKKAEQDDSAFIEDIIALCHAVNADIMFTMIDDASSARPTFNIYTTSLADDFIQIPNNYYADCIEPDDYLTSDLSDCSTRFYVYTSSLYFNFKFYALESATQFSFSHSKFYVSTISCTDFLTLLNQDGYDVTIMTNDNTDGDSDIMAEMLTIFLMLTLFMFFSAICLAFTKRREILIKKVHGYSDTAVFRSTFFSTCIVTIFIFLGIILATSVLITLKYPHTFGSFIAFALKYIIAYMCVCLFLILVAFLAVQFKHDACEIRGNRPSKSLFFLSVFFRIIVSLVTIWGLTNALSAIRYNHNLYSAKENMGEIADAYSVFSLNSGSSDMISNHAEYSSKSAEFIRAISSQYEAVIVDSSEFLGESAGSDGILYVSQNYFNINPIYTTDGQVLDTSTIPTDTCVLLLPDNCDEEFVASIASSEIDLLLIYYASGQYFKTFNQYAGIDTQGMLSDPLVMILDDDLLDLKAEGIIGEQFLLVNCNSSEPYTEMRPIIEECGMENVILEVQSINDIFDVAILSSNYRMLQYIIVSILYLLVLVVIVLFETTIFYENNKRMLTIKKLYGYGYHAYSGIFYIKVLILFAISVVSKVLNFTLFFAFFVAATDAFIFVYFIKKLEKNSIVLYLKGDM